MMENGVSSKCPKMVFREVKKKQFRTHVEILFLLVSHVSCLIDLCHYISVGADKGDALRIHVL